MRTVKSAFPEIGGDAAAVRDTATHRFDAGQFARLASYGTREFVTAGQVLADIDDENTDLLLVGTAVVESTVDRADEAREVFLRYTEGQFAGELNVLTGQTRALAIRVVEGGTIHRVPRDAVRLLMARETDLSDLLLRALLARRQMLRDSVRQNLCLVGDPGSAAAMSLRTFLVRRGIAHEWLDGDSPAGKVVLVRNELTAEDLPVAVTPRRTLRRVTTGQLSDALGLTYRGRAGRAVNDLVVVGSGPAGLAAAVYGASEGLETVLLDGVGTGGQAASSARIENYLGFPFGLSGADLTTRAALQALKFGAHIASPCPVTRLRFEDGLHRLELPGAVEITARSVLVATGAAYRNLPLDRWHDFVGAGIYYAATDLEVQPVAGEHVVVVGGANSAGQAALHLARYGAHVTLVVRAADLYAGMSAYLVERILADPEVEVRTATEVTQLHGDHRLRAVSLTTRDGGGTVERSCAGLFCFIGAVPATSWLAGIALDADGFVRTDVQLTVENLGNGWAAGTTPLPYETSRPGVFAAGDVRSGSIKRVAAAVGEGATAVRWIHQALAR